jgi:hypothetical protein
MPDWLASGFSPVGLLVVVLQQIPGIVWALRPPKLDPFAKNSGTWLVEILEKTFGVATLVLVVVVLASGPVPPVFRTLFRAGAFLVLAAYYVLYIQYYRGITAWPVLLGMSAFPPSSFVLIALSQGNVLAIITGVVFGIVHVALTYNNLGPGAKQDSQQTARISRERDSSGSANTRIKLGAQESQWTQGKTEARSYCAGR